MNTDNELLRQYLEKGSEAAFAELVQRHVAWVYSMALRLVNGERPLAEDVTQAVFTRLAQRAYQLVGHPTLVGWLHTTTYYTATNLVRAEARRHTREQEAATMSDYDSTPEVAWAQLRPVLDDAVNQLKKTDREAVLLRFYQHKSHREIGEQLGMNEEAARKRGARALEQLRQHFANRGINASTALLVSLLAANTVGAAPEALATNVTGAAIAGAGQAGWVNAGLRFLYMNTKTKIAIGAAIMLLLALSLKLVYSPDTHFAPSQAAATQRVEAPALKNSNTTRAEKIVPVVARTGEPLDAITGTKTEVAPGVANYAFSLNNKKFSFFLISGDKAIPMDYNELRKDAVFTGQLAQKMKKGFSGLSRKLADLPQRFGLTTEQADKLINVAAEQQAQFALLELQYSSANLTSAELADFSRQKQMVDQTAEASIRQIFPTDEAVAAYQTYLAQAGERSDVSALQNAVMSVHLDLRPDQSQALVEIIANEKQKANLPDPVQLAMLGLTGGDTVAYRRQLADAREAIVQSAAAVLSPEQLQTARDNEHVFLQSTQMQVSGYMQALVVGSTQAGDGLIIGSGGGNQTLNVVKAADSIAVNSTATSSIGTASVEMTDGKTGGSFSFKPAIEMVIPNSGGGGAN